MGGQYKNTVFASWAQPFWGKPRVCTEEKVSGELSADPAGGSASGATARFEKKKKKKKSEVEWGMQ